MPDILIVNDVTRFTVNGTMAGKNTANIFDFRIDTDPGTGRDEADADMAQVLITAYGDHIVEHIVDQWELTSVNWLDLDNEDASTGIATSSDDFTAPVPGEDTNAGLPTNVSVLVTKATSGGRGHRNGRLYVPGYSEATTTDADPSNLSSSAIADIQDDWDDFLGYVNGTHGGIGATYGATMVVVHVLTRNPDNGHPLTGEGLDVADLQVNSRLATQRRRLR